MRIDLGQAAKWQQQQMGNLGSKDKLFFFQVVEREREREKQRQMESCVREARRCCHAFN